MKDINFFFLKNLMGEKIKMSFSSFCNGDLSTSTLHQIEKSLEPFQVPSLSSNIESVVNNAGSNVVRKSVTLKEFMLQLEPEEEKSREEEVPSHKDIDNQDVVEFDFPRRMSCVNHSDILRSTRNALNEHPRLSLDGRGAMHRLSSCSVRNALNEQPRLSLDGPGAMHRLSSGSASNALPEHPRLSLDGHGTMHRPSSLHNDNTSRQQDGLKLGRMLQLPNSVGGESVIWCRPGVVLKLMGLETMPLPISRLNNCIHKKNKPGKENLSNAIRSRNLRRKVGKLEMERTEMTPNSTNSCRNKRRAERGGYAGCSTKSCS